MPFPMLKDKAKYAKTNSRIPLYIYVGIYSKEKDYHLTLKLYLWVCCM